MHNIRPTSLEAYATLNLPAKQAEVLAVLVKNNRRGLTRSEIRDRLGWEISSVCGRVNELLTRGFAEEDGTRKYKKTGHHQLVVFAKDPTGAMP